jgi:Skp family chaperone for outer membrane proteins
MKKVIAMFAIAALTACGGASTEPATDSATTTVDTSVATPEVKQDTNYYKELNKKRKAELDSASN